jgi:hypothetical protein
VKNGDNAFAASKWVSPKRTCSYPYEKVYNTLNFSKKITVIPIVKDEGFDGDRDFLQWDTVYLIESKHSKNGILPSVGDIKDGLLFKEAVENGIEVTMG